MNSSASVFHLPATNESVAIRAIEFVSIPHLSIIDNEAVLSDILEKYFHEMEGLLGGIYQIYKNIGSTFRNYKDISLELLWKTTQVDNQPYKASIRLFFIARAIDNNDDTAIETVDRIIKQCLLTFNLEKYECTDIRYDALSEIISLVDSSHIFGIIKEERSEALMNAMLPSCFAYDILPLTTNDLSGIVNALTEYPNCAVSAQLLPTFFEEQEIKELDQHTQLLEMFSRGVSDQNVGNISFALAEKHAKNYRYYAQHKNSPLFLFNLVVYGDGNAAYDISNKVITQISIGTESTSALKTIPLTKEQTSIDGMFYALPWILQEQIINLGRSETIWNTGQYPESLYRLPFILSTEEAAGLFRLPIGSDRITVGFTINESGKGNKTYASDLINTGDIVVGKLTSSSGGASIGFSLNDLAKHMLIVGTPGSGKTTFSVSLLDRLWKDHGIPFLVIEPAKNEYRAMIQSIPDLQVFTPGKNFISPFVFNPFVPPTNVRLETYKSTLKTAFSAAVSMSTPLDKIFEESINNCYSDFRWLDSYTVSDKGRIFNISDFIKCFQETFEAIGYTGDAKNIGRAGVVRLNGLLNLFDNYFSIPIEDLLQKPTVIELAAIENPEEKALIISLLLLSILAYVNSNYVGEGGLKNIVLLEEAHVLLDADTNAGQGDANPSAIARGLVKRMLAEIRSYGVGIIIADQSPRKVSTDVVALTDMKMVFRLVESEDKQIIGDSTNMSEQQVKQMSKLKPGQAFLFFNKLDEPELVITPDYRLENKISITLSDQSISQLSTYWQTRQDKLRPYPQCNYCQYCCECCDYQRRILAREIARRIFVRHIKAGSTEFDPIYGVLGHISKLVKAELNDEAFSPELLSCVKVHFWRKILYETRIPVKEVQIENSIGK